ncbi:MFS transporter [Microbacterium sp. 179-I 3D4 NHS]|uniref:MFS transporter n=1 Tax=Microbacterium sp. 179-I 3D4 NHS TaxID=3142381 RepID=UPI00399FB6D2
MTTTTAPHRLWRNARYLTWLVSDTSKGLASALFGFAIPLLALIVTNDPAQAGIIAGAGLVTRLLLTLVGGILADRHRRVLLMLVGSLLGILLAGAFTLLAVFDALTFATLLVIDVLLAARSGLFDVAGESAIKEIVPDDAMGRAQAANQARDAALHLAGGPLGGLLLGVGGWLVGLVMTLCHLLAAGTAGLLARGEGAAGVRENPDPSPDARRVEARPAVDATADPDFPAADARRAETGADVEGTKRSGRRELREGFAWLFSRPDLGGVLLITTIVNLGFNAAITTAVYALQQAGHSELLIGTVSAGIGAVMLLGAVLAPLLVPRVGTGVLTIAGLVVVAVGATVLSAVTEPWAIALVLGVSVLLLPALNAGMMGYFMVATPTRLLGRANGAAAVLGMGAMPLAPLIAGFGLTGIGRQNTVLVCAALCAVAVVLAVGNRALRALPVEARWAAHAARYER